MKLFRNLSRSEKIILSGIIAVCSLLTIISLYLLTSNQRLQSRASSGTVPSCPSGTQLLFSKVGPLKIGDTTVLNGKLTSLVGSNWNVENREGLFMANSGRTLTVTFPNQITFDTALIFDNDPKTGEKSWTINGKTLPISGQGTWGPPYKLNLVSKSMTFDNGGDSPHFNVCIKSSSSSPSATPAKIATKTPTAKPTNTPTAKPSKSPTPKPSSTPTPKPSKTPTPTKTPTRTSTTTPTKTPTKTLTPTRIPSETRVPTPTKTPPPFCPKPNPVSNLQIVCPLCQ